MGPGPFNQTFLGSNAGLCKGRHLTLREEWPQTGPFNTKMCWNYQKPNTKGQAVKPFGPDIPLRNSSRANVSVTPFLQILHKPLKLHSEYKVKFLVACIISNNPNKANNPFDLPTPNPPGRAGRSKVGLIKWENREMVIFQGTSDMQI